MGTVPFRAETSGTAASLLRSSVMARIPATAGEVSVKTGMGFMEAGTPA